MPLPARARFSGLSAYGGSHAQRRVRAGRGVSKAQSSTSWSCACGQEAKVSRRACSHRKLLWRFSSPPRMPSRYAFGSSSDALLAEALERRSFSRSALPRSGSPCGSCAERSGQREATSWLAPARLREALARRAQLQQPHGAVGQPPRHGPPQLRSQDVEAVAVEHVHAEYRLPTPVQLLGQGARASEGLQSHTCRCGRKDHAKAWARAATRRWTFAIARRQR
mmetsp:Transcript_56375/g.170619  ORF Transcript_56375/g.170619 Transcript_56375/m.170619 type:complete len:223 (-) Transcript_56375:297-965(-)